MKKLIIISILVVISCSTRKNEKTNQINIPQLSEDEIIIVNNFLDAELATERYKYYRDLDIVLIEEAGNGIGNLLAYEYAHKEFLQMERFDKRGDKENRFFIDSLQTKKLKEKLKKVENYYWKISDISNRKVSLMKDETLRNIIKSGAYINLPEKLILYLTRPLIIDENNALISFNIGSSQSGFDSLNHYTALMKKVNNKWVLSAYYYDGVFY